MPPMQLYTSKALRSACLLWFAMNGVGGAFAQDHCWIKYSYDAAGNRIKRE